MSYGANLGDYECPHCKQTSLRRDASLCPLCRGAIDGVYWDKVRLVELADVPRRRAAEAAAVKDAARKAADEDRRELSSAYFSYILPALTYYTALVVIAIRGTESIHLVWTHALALVPILNWIIVVIVMFSEDRVLFRQVCAAWAIVGVVMFVASWLRQRL